MRIKHSYRYNKRVIHRTKVSINFKGTFKKEIDKKGENRYSSE